MSHVDRKIVIYIIEELNKRFGEIMPLSFSRGKVHIYLGMTLDDTTPGRLIITMYNHIDGLIENPGQMYKEGAG